MIGSWPTFTHCDSDHIAIGCDDQSLVIQLKWTVSLVTASSMCRSGLHPPHHTTRGVPISSFRMNIS